MKPRTIILVVSGFVAVAVVFIVTLTLNGTQPFGWDAPYDLFKDRLLTEVGVFGRARSQGGLRAGYLLASVVSPSPSA